jgi:transposase
MIQLTPQMRILVAVEPVDFRQGIDGLCRLCRRSLSSDPFSGAVFVFRNRRGTSVKILAYDGQGFWLCQKRMSQGCFRHWPESANGEAGKQLLAHELSVLLSGGNPSASQAAPQWRRVTPPLAA